MNAAERFLRYVAYDTQSDENSTTVPSKMCLRDRGQAPPVSTAPAAPAADTPAHDKLDDLLAFGQQFDNIIIK